MDAIELLKEDHRAVEALFKRVERIEDDEEGSTEELAGLFEQIRTLLKAHETIEQEIFYPAAREAGEEADCQVDESFVEHHLVDILVGEIGELSPDEDEWCAKMTVLQELIEHHVDDEEDELFPAVKKGLEKEQLVELGERMESRKDELLGETAGVGGEDESQRRQQPQRRARASRTKPPTKRGNGRSGSRRR